MIATLCIAGFISVGTFAWLAWDTRIRYGPIYYGNARWRREAPIRAARLAQLDSVAALTAEDREWLTAMGWAP